MSARTDIFHDLSYMIAYVRAKQEVCLNREISHFMGSVARAAVAKHTLLVPPLRSLEIFVTFVKKVLATLSFRRTPLEKSYCCGDESDKRNCQRVDDLAPRRNLLHVWPRSPDWVHHAAVRRSGCVTLSRHSAGSRVATIGPTTLVQTQPSRNRVGATHCRDRAARADACVRLRAAIYRVRTKLPLRARRHRGRNRCGRR